MGNQGTSYMGGLDPGKTQSVEEKTPGNFPFLYSPGTNRKVQIKSNDVLLFCLLLCQGFTLFDRSWKQTAFVARRKVCDSRRLKKKTGKVRTGQRGLAWFNRRPRVAKRCRLCHLEGKLGRERITVRDRFPETMAVMRRGGARDK